MSCKMAGNSNKSQSRKSQDKPALMNGAVDPSGDGDHMPPGRRRRHQPHTPAHFDWRLLMSGNQFGLLAFIFSILTALYSAGWIPGLAKQTDVTQLQGQLVKIEGGLDGISKELREARGEFLKATTSIARIEGRLEADAQIRARTTRQPTQPKPVQKAKGLFD
jgi:hypothetical protein